MEVDKITVINMINDEFGRISREGTFNEGFWQNVFDLAGRSAYLSAKQARAMDALALQREAHEAASRAQTIEEKREARKIAKHAATAKGLERLYRRDGRADPLVQGYQRDSKWVSDARDLAVHMVRWQQEVRKHTV